MKNNKVDYKNYESFDYDSFSYGFIKMNKPGGKVKTSNKIKRPKGHQASIRKGGK